MSTDKQRATVFSFLCLLSFMAGMASKENAAMFPFVLILVEVVFFHDLKDPRIWRMFCIAAILISGILIMAIIFLGYFPDSVSYLSGYKNRPFSYVERMLTEPRILLFYLSLVFYPAPGRLAFLHDISVSTSLVQPWTTLPSIAFISFLMIFGFWILRRQPLVGFAIIFFFMNHVIESTIIPLELVYEHRNYLPSMFLFVPIAAGFMALLKYYQSRQKMIFSVLYFFMFSLILLLGSGTYVRNMVWGQRKGVLGRCHGKGTPSGPTGP